MGPHPAGPLGKAGGAIDWTAEMRALTASRKGLVWLRPDAGDGPHAALWYEGGDEPLRAERETLRELVLYLQARFRGA